MVEPFPGVIWTFSREMVQLALGGHRRSATTLWEMWAQLLDRRDERRATHAPFAPLELPLTLRKTIFLRVDFEG